MFGRALRGARRTDDSPDHGWASLFLSNGAGEDIFECRNTGPQMPHLHAMRGGKLKEPSRILTVRLRITGNEDAHDVFFGLVTFKTSRVQHLDKRRRVTLHAQFEHTAA